MMADNIEHVISYWMMFQKFHSPALGGFAVISHWLPYLLFSLHVGALADRFDTRRMIQLSMGIFMAVSAAWGWLFYTDTLEIWHAMVLLILHGVAGVLWSTPAQLLLHQIVGSAQLQSAVRLTATARYLGMLGGPGVGAALLLTLGPNYAILANVLIYLPMMLFMFKAPAAAPRPSAVSRFSDIVSTLKDISDNRIVVTMICLSGAAAFLIGNAYQAQMPGFATDLGHGNADFSYSMLLAADAAGALTAGFVLESRGLLRPLPRTAIVLAMCWCVALGSFAVTSIYPLALALLFAAGFLELSFNSMSQTLVQLNAPVAIRGRVLGAYAMASLGMRTFSGLTVGLAAGALGIHSSLALSCALLIAVTGVLLMRQRL